MTKARIASAFVLVLAATSTAAANTTVTGKLELPAAPELPPMTRQGFVPRAENALRAPQPQAVAPYVVVVLDGTPGGAAPQVSWSLLGDAFSHPVIAAMAGADVVITNTSHTPRTLSTVEDKTLSGELLNPTGGKTLHVEAGKTYTVHDPDAPYVWGRIVVVATPYIGYLDATGKFEIPDVPEGTYKLRVYYKDGWVDVDRDTVTVPAKGKPVDASAKVASLKPGAAK
jgi:hypothetical protein|nr:hypothetical protein [Kofleriaceae bacterium]